nr:unnamed protein product [Callosobruchus analis]
MFFPLSSFHDIVKNAEKLSTNFNKSDHVFIIGGSNDALMKGFIQTELLKETFGNFIKTDVLLATVPQWKCRRPALNKIIEHINDQIRRICDESGLHLIDLDTSLQHYRYRKYSNIINNAGKHIVFDKVKDIISKDSLNSPRARSKTRDTGIARVTSTAKSTNAVTANNSPIICRREERNTECCGITLESKFCNKNLVICIYRPPSAEINIFLDNLTNLLDTVSNIANNIILCGDLNIDAMLPTIHNHLLQDLLNSYNLRNHCEDPTRTSINKNNKTSNTAIDYMISNIDENRLKCTIFEPHISDRATPRVMSYS